MYLDKVFQKSENRSTGDENTLQKTPHSWKLSLRCRETSETAEYCIKKNKGSLCDTLCALTYNFQSTLPSNDLHWAPRYKQARKYIERISVVESVTRGEAEELLWGSSYRSQSLEQLDGQAWKCRVVLVVDVFGQDRNKVVSMSTWIKHN